MDSLQVLTQPQVNDLYEMLKHLVGVLDKYAIGYCLTDGSLLGAIRHQGFIPWDDDIDIAVEKKDITKIRNLKYILDCEGKYKLGGVGKFMKLKKDNIWIDIFILDDGVFPQKHFANLSFKEQEYKPFKKSKFGDIVVKVPQKAEEYLDRIFKDWRDIAYIYNHKQQIKIKLPMCDKLRKPLLPSK